MSLMNTDDLGAAMREAARVLEPGGRYCVAIVHPLNSAGAFASREADAPFVIEGSYFEHAQREMPVERDGLEMTFLDAHRPLEDYFVALEAGGYASNGFGRSRTARKRRAKEPCAGGVSPSSCTSARSPGA